MERNIYKIGKELFITSDEEIKEGDWIFNKEREPSIIQCIGKGSLRGWKKIVLTTDQDLIKDGVQSIDDKFLQWFVKNPSCEWVEVKEEFIQTPDNLKDGFYYKIIIPQETIEEAAERYAESKSSSFRNTHIRDFIAGAKYQGERMYSEEDLIVILEQAMKDCHTEGLDMHYSGNYKYLKDWFEQFKKK